MPTTINPDYLLLEDTITPSTVSPPTTITDSMSPASPTIMDMWMSQLQKDHPEISFVIPSQHDNQHIDNMMSFKRLLEQVGNTAYDTIASNHQHQQQHSGLVDSLGQPITHEQISNSAVLNMADLKGNNMSVLEQFFAGADMNSLINYLWLGVVTSLVILTVIFVLFSCYFYRKFREWKRCNKDIRAHLNNDMYPGTIVPCDTSLNPEAAYYQMESSPPPPPCYTIATGLPTYDEALHHHHQQQFAFGMKFIYPKLAAVHHQASSLMSSWEKYDGGDNGKDPGKMMITNKSHTTKSNKLSLSSSSLSSSSSLPKCKSSYNSNSHSSNTNSLSSSVKASALMMPPSYDVAASMALLAPEEMTSDNSVSIAIPLHQQQMQKTLNSNSVATEEASSDLTDIITV